MYASKLIEKLQKSIDEHGDLPVYSYDDGIEFEIEIDELAYYKAQEYTSWNHNPLPERFAL